MEQSIDLKQLERKVWTSFFEDGIWDICLGLWLMAMAVGSLLTDGGVPEATQIIVYISLITAACLFLLLGKRFITVPLIGRVTFRAKGKTRIKKTIVLFAVSALVGLIAFSAVAFSASGYISRALPMDIFVPAIWVGNMLIVFSLAAYVLHYKRLYLIGVMFAIGLPLDIILREVTHQDLTFIAFGLPAMVILTMGAIVLIRFLRKYPRLEKE